MEETGVDRPAETCNHKSGEHQRHAQIEISAQERLEQVCCACFLLNTSSYAYVSNGHRTLPWQMSLQAVLVNWDLFLSAE
jgi:hypothetical protein